MTRKDATRLERELRAREVYKPYVGADTENIYVESYPLTAIIRKAIEVDPQLGPYQHVKLTDCTLPRLGLDSTVRFERLYVGQVLQQHVAAWLLSLHAEAHARSIEQDYQAMCRNAEVA